MTEIVVFAVLALHGILCTAILVAYLWRAARWREAHWEIPEPGAPDKLEPPDLAYPELEEYPAAEIFGIMREFFPTEHERYLAGRLGYAERRWVWQACCSIHDARVEIDELCS